VKQSSLGGAAHHLAEAGAETLAVWFGAEQGSEQRLARFHPAVCDLSRLAQHAASLRVAAKVNRSTGIADAG
jgi:hypothetical protein